MMLSARFSFLTVIAAAGLLLSSGASAIAADVKATGTITVGGNPLASGKVTFHLKNGQFVGSKVTAGKYTVDRLPAGTHKVTVEGKGVAAKYTLDGVTPLTAEVKKEDLNLDLNLQ